MLSSHCLSKGDPLAVFVDCAISIFVRCKAVPDFLVVLSVVIRITMIRVIVMLPTCFDLVWTLIERIDPAFLDQSHEGKQKRMVTRVCGLQLPLVDVGVLVILSSLSLRLSSLLSSLLCSLLLLLSLLGFHLLLHLSFLLLHLAFLRVELHLHLLLLQLNLSLHLCHFELLAHGFHLCLVLAFLLLHSGGSG